MRFELAVPRTPAEWERLGHWRRRTYTWTGVIAALVVSVAGLQAGSSPYVVLSAAGQVIAVAGSALWVSGNLLSKADVSSMTNPQADARASAGAYWWQARQDVGWIAGLILLGFALQAIGTAWSTRP